MKRILSLILIFAALLLTAAPAYAALPPSAEPQYTDAAKAAVTLSIDDAGNAILTLFVTGKPSLTRTAVVSYLERKVGTNWVRVDIGTPNNAWIYTTKNQTFSRSYNTQLHSSGEYRATCEFTFYGTVTETVTRTFVTTY